MLMNLIGSICLTDIPKDLIRVGSDGKKYLTVYIGQRRQTSQYGHTHFIKAYVPKERREDGVDYFIGDAKPSEYQTQQTRIMAGAESFARENTQRSAQPQRQYQQPVQQAPPPQRFSAPDDNGDLPF